MNSIKYGITLMAFLAALSGCQTQKSKLDEHHFTNKLFIDTQELTQEVAVKPNSSVETRMLSIGTAMPVEEAVSGVFVADTNYVATYRSEYDAPQVKAFPPRNCVISNPEVTIESGSNTSSSAVITFRDMNTLDRSQVYVMPVVLKNVTDLNVISSKKVVYYIFEGAALINTVANMSQNYFKIPWKSDVKNLSTITVEALIYDTDFSNQGSTRSAISSVFGIEEYFLIRIGDGGFPQDAIQIRDPNGRFPSAANASSLPTNKWVHIAVVWDGETGDRIIYHDGVEQTRDKGARGTLDLSKGECFVGWSLPGRWLEGWMSEVRVWGVQRTQEEIQANMYEVDPETDGLIAYWKMNEGKGNNVADVTGHGNNLTAQFPLGWKSVSLPEN